MAQSCDNTIYSKSLFFFFLCSWRCFLLSCNSAGYGKSVTSLQGMLYGKIEILGLSSFFSPSVPTVFLFVCLSRLVAVASILCRIDHLSIHYCGAHKSTDSGVVFFVCVSPSSYITLFVEQSIESFPQHSHKSENRFTSIKYALSDTH